MLLFLQKGSYLYRKVGNGSRGDRYWEILGSLVGYWEDERLLGLLGYLPPSDHPPPKDMVRKPKGPQGYPQGQY